ncbi:MAG: hypothetical protein GXP25_09555 [Planctomycetes bacterium]|nr:hypothetical protein [Planctomycetota bacterium]
MAFRIATNRAIGPPFLLLVSVLIATHAVAAELRTADGLRCRIGPQGRIAVLTIGAAAFAPGEASSSGFAIRDCASGTILSAVFPVTEKDGGIQQRGAFDKAQLSFAMEARSAGDRIVLSGAVTDERRTDDRAVDVIFRLPFPAKDLTWWQDIRTPVTASAARKHAAEKAGQPCTAISFAPIRTRRLRIVQPQDGGCTKAPNTLWLAEVEVFGRDQNRNILQDREKIRIKANSTSGKYSTDRLTDGIRNDTWDDNWLKRGWASGKKPGEKWVEFDLGEETEIARVDLYWCLERFGYATSRTFHLERWDGGKWVRIEPTEVKNQGALGDAEKASFKTEDVTFENSIYPFACVTDGDRAGIAMAVAADSPCVFNMSYLPSERCLEIVFRFGLSQLPRNPKLKGRAPFKFALYRVDPKWGFRDAARRYYAMYPNAFRTRTDRYGLWLFVGTVPEALNPQHYMFHEGGPRGAEMDELYNIYTCPYVIMGQREFDSDARNYEEAMADLAKLGPEVKSYYGASRKALIENCSLRDPKGKVIIRLRRRGGSLDGQAVATFPMNPDPSLWEDQGKPTAGMGTIEYAQRVVDSNPYVDGIYVDSLSSWGTYRNSRREHFAYADLPLTHDDKGNVIIWNRFGQVEFLRALKKMLHSRGKILFGNGIRHKRMWCGFECDVQGVEANQTVHKSASHYCWFRTIAYHKPFLLLYYYKYPSLECPREAASEFIQSAIAYGIAPEIRPFGKFTQRDMDLYDQFIPILRQTMCAGWEPVTYARASDSRVWLERFGGGRNGLFFNVYNPLSDEVRVTIEIDSKALGVAAGAVIKELVTGETYPGESPELKIPPKSLRTLQVGDAPLPPKEITLSKDEVIERVLRLREQASGDGNLLSNPSFEKVRSDGRPVEWGVSPHGSATIEVMNTEAHTGKRSLHLSDPDEKGSANVTIPFAYFQPNTTYELSAWIKQSAESDAPGRLWYQWCKERKRLLAKRFDFPKTTEWKECRWELVPPEGADELRMLLGTSVPEKADFYIDDVRFVRRKKKEREE